MITDGTLSPAYGRDYKNRASILADLNAGKDFYVSTYTGSTYCSLRDLADGWYQVRDKTLRKVWTVKVASGTAK